MSEISRDNTLTLKYISQKLKFFINLKVFITMVGYTGLKESSTKIMETDESLIISCRAYLFLSFFDDKKII